MGKVKQWAEDMAEEYLDELIKNVKNKVLTVAQAVDEAKENDYLFLEIPDYGGHVGFYLPGKVYYNEQRTLEFFEKQES